MIEVVILKGTGAYGSMEYFADKLSQTLLEEQISHEVVNLNDKNLDFMKLTNKLINDKPKLCIAFNAMKFCINNIPYYKVLNLKHLAILMDHPIYHTPSLDLNSNNLFITCPDYDRVVYLKDKLNFNNSFVLYHAADKNIKFKPKDKCFDMVFFGGILDFEEIRDSWRQKYNMQINQILDASIELGMYNSFLPTDEMLNLAMQYYHVNFNQEDELKFHEVLIPEIDKYLRTFHRYKFIDKLQEYKIDIYGEGCWEKYFSNSKNFNIKPSVKMEDSIKIMQQSKIALNCTITTFYNGSHDRPLSAAMAGSVVLSNYSPFFEETFGDNAVLTNLMDIDKAKDRIDKVLGDDRLRIEMAEGARESVSKNHTWNNRVIEIAQLLK